MFKGFILGTNNQRLLCSQVASLFSNVAMSHTWTCPRTGEVTTVKFKDLRDVKMPPLRPMSLEEKEKVGMRLGHDRHMCHRIEPTWCIAMPESDISKAYLEWYTSGDYGKPGILLMHPRDWTEQFGAEELERMTIALQLQGRPLSDFLLVYNLE